MGRSANSGACREIEAIAPHRHDTIAQVTSRVARPVVENWADASTGAASHTKFGMAGYLATITSASENDYIASRVSAADVWIGASGVAAEGARRWMTGPEANTTFSFTSWNTNQPDDAGDEDCASTNQAGSLRR